MKRFLSFFWVISLIIFLTALLIVYAFLPDQVVITEELHIQPGKVVTRNMFFYISLSFFLATNIIFYSFEKLLKYVPAYNQGTSSTFSIASLKEKIALWIRSFCLVLNLFFISILIFIGVLNNSDQIDISYSGVLVFIGTGLIGLWLIFLVIIALRGK